jgi:hypothetical protein
MADKTMPTPGPWRVFQNTWGLGVTTSHADVAHCGDFCSVRTREEETANARLIAAAGTAAHECAEMGYTDAVSLFQALPEALQLLENLPKGRVGPGDVERVLNRAAGKESE